MLDFDYQLKTNVLFGKNKINELPRILEIYGKKVLLVYGGQSIKKNGLYDQVRSLLKDFEVFELSGIQANPKIDSVNQGVTICQKENIDVILAVGGGSVLDASKAIGIGNYYQGDAWDLISGKVQPTNCLPLVGISTLAASGTETGMGAVISNLQTNEKLGIDYEKMYYRHIIMDPTYTMTVPQSHTSAGIADIFSHLLEQYITGDYSLLSKNLCEAVMKTVIHYAPIVLENLNDYEARAQIMWAATLANNGILSLGNQFSGWACHAIEHELSALYDISHGVGLAIITPAWMEYVLNEQTISQFARYGKEVFGIVGNDDEIAKESIKCTKEFFKSLKLPTSLKEIHIDECNFKEISQKAVTNGFLQYAFVPLNEEDILNILNKCKE